MKRLLLTITLLTGATVAQETQHATMYGIPVVWRGRQAVETPQPGGVLLPGGTLGETGCSWDPWQRATTLAMIHQVIDLVTLWPCGDDILSLLWLALAEEMQG